MRRHGWYLVEEFQTFSLFSNKVVEDTKSSIAAKILTFEEKQPTTYPLAVPPFPTITPTTKLKDLVGPNSFMLFNVLGLSYEWLKCPRQVGRVQDYREDREWVRTVKLVNDIAEQGIKMVHDYANILTINEDMRVKLLQGVETNRKMYPNFQKKTLNRGS